MVTLGVIAANAAVFFYQLARGDAAPQFVHEYGLFPVELIHGANLPSSQGIAPALSLLTSMFLHAGWGHLIGNMWFLWIFGDNIEDELGHLRFLLFYLLGGVAAGLTHVIMNPDSVIPTVGASGAVSAVLGAYLVLHPSIRIRTLLVLGFLIDVVRVPAVFFLGLWFLWQFVGSMASGATGGIAFGAHIGGFVVGAAYAALHRQRRL